MKDLTDESYQGSKSLTQKWKDMTFSHWGTEAEATGVDVSLLRHLAKESIRLPSDFTPHPRIQKTFIDQRLKALESDKIDWPTAEAMALASLKHEGFNVRLAGEDVERGTFSQRHMVLTDQNTMEGYCPIKENIEGGRFTVSNTNLQEFGSMQYEFGYSMENPNNLAIWEA